MGWGDKPKNILELKLENVKEAFRIAIAEWEKADKNKDDGKKKEAARKLVEDLQKTINDLERSN